MCCRALRLTRRATHRYSHSVVHSVLTVVSAVFVDYLLLGVVLATAGWCARHMSEVRGNAVARPDSRPQHTSRLLSNRYLRTVGMLSHAVEQRVEWCAPMSGWKTAGTQF